MLVGRFPFISAKSLVNCFAPFLLFDLSLFVVPDGQKSGFDFLSRRKQSILPKMWNLFFRYIISHKCVKSQFQSVKWVRQSATVTFWFTFSKAPKTPLYASCSVPKDRKHHEEVDTKNRAKSLKDDLFLLLFDGNEISYRYSVSVLWNAVLVFFSRIQLCLLPSVQRSRSWSTGFYF